MPARQKSNVQIDRDMGIVLSDGTRLSAQVWMPAGATKTPVPAILEYLPYRKSDGTAPRDHGMHLCFAEHGYVCLRVDRRGCGDSEGVFDDEYSEQELADGVEVINWIAAQAWCSGRVGIQGISWGGFNGLQLAARRPEPLRAVISIGTTVNRYTDDIHYKGGIQLSENIGWAATATSWNSMPPDPELRDDWREIWQNRLEQTPFLESVWTGHKDRDAYWKHGSVCEDFGAIKAPVLVMGGLHDGYRNAMAELVEHSAGVVKGVAGPWNHKYPNISGIEPSIDYIGEALRWWDHWLKDIDTGVDQDPDYRAFVMDSCAPDPALTARSGRWVAEQNWPSENVEDEVFAFRRDGLVSGGDNTGPIERSVTPDLNCGQACGEYFPFGFGPGELPGDQTPDDALSLCFDTPVLSGTRDILGAPVVRLMIASDRPRAQIIVRLCDLRPDGTSALISLGMLNLRHRAGNETPQDLVPGEPFEVTISLDQSAYRLPEGHRLRVALSSSYWPYAWPEAENATLTITGGMLEIPRRKTIAETDEWQFDPPREMAARPMRQLDDVKESKTRQVNPDTGEITLTITSSGDRREDLVNGLITGSALTEVWKITPGDPCSARAEITWKRWFQRGNTEATSEVVSTMRGDAEHFYVSRTISACENGRRLYLNANEDKISR